MGIVGLWGLGIAVSAVACGSSFDSEDCRASRTCAQAGAGGGGAPPSNAGAPAGGDDAGQPVEDGGASGSPTTPETSGAGAGAGGEGGGAVVAINPPPTVISVSPTDATASVEPDAVIKITFSEPLSDESVNKTSVQLLHRGKAVEGTPTHADSVITFTPERPLGLLGEYEVAVTTGVTDAEGAPLAEAFSSTFTVRDGKFYGKKTVVEEDVWSLAGHVPVESSGSVLLTWTDLGEGDGCPVLYQRVLRGEFVGTAEQLSGKDVRDCAMLTAAASPAGVSAVTWSELSGDPALVGQYRDGAWSQGAVPTVDEFGTALNLGIAPDGTVSLFQNVPDRTYVHRTTIAGEWSKTPDDLGATGSSPSATAISYDEAGRGLAVWGGTKSDRDLVYYSFLKGPSSKWSSATAIPGSQADESADGYDRSFPALSMDPKGNAVALWVAVDGPSAAPTLVFSRFNPATSAWTTAKPIAPSIGGSALYEAPAVVFDGETFVAAFTAEQGNRMSTLVTRFDSTGGVWSMPEKRQAQQDQSSSERMPKLVTDGRGNLLLVYPNGTSPSYKLYYQRYAKGAWSPTQLLAPAPTSSLYPWSLSSNADGLAAAVWGEDDGNGLSAQKVQVASFY